MRRYTFTIPKWLRPSYVGDEIAFGIALALALHAIPVVVIIAQSIFPSVDHDDKPLVAKPAIAATLLQLGKPIDLKKLPDRIVPEERTAPKPDVVASREEPIKKSAPPKKAPPPKTKESDLERLIANSEPFAEKPKKETQREGSALGVQGGTETDPSKVRAGDLYAALLSAWLHERWQYPTVISQGEANRLCVTFEIRIAKNMVIWHVRGEPMRASGNPLFDDSAKSMFMKLVDDKTPLPEPPPEIEGNYRARNVAITLTGDTHGDGSRCTR